MLSSTRRLGVVLAALPLSLALAACGGGDDKADEPKGPTWKGQDVTVADATLQVPTNWDNNTGEVGDIETVFANTPVAEEPTVALIADARESYKESLDEYADESMTWDEELKTRNDDVTIAGVKFFHVTQKADEASGLSAQEFYGAIHDGNVYKFDFTLGEASKSELVEEIIGTVDFK